ncbi:MAG: NAD(P)-binding domain-containing protein [Candidatus Nanopelagicales bacterium]
MRIGVLGAGQVGTTLATALAKAGHQVSVGSRDAGSAALAAWSGDHPGARVGSYLDVAGDEDLVINATPGLASASILQTVRPALGSSVVWDVANPLDFSDGVAVVHPDGVSLGEQLQTLLPDNAVVKVLNTVNTDVMVDPRGLGADHQVFLCGNDDSAKDSVRAVLADLGWTADQVIDLGDISAARGTESYLLLWIRLMSTLGTTRFNIGVVRP